MTISVPDRVEIEVPVRSTSSTAQRVASLPGVFLMTNSLEIGGSERQFVELAKSLNPSCYRLRLGCLNAVGGFREGFEHIPEFSVGGSLYKLESLKARWRLVRHLREHHVAVAHSFDFYTNLTLIPAARVARTPAVIGSHRQIGDLLTDAQSRTQRAMFGWCDKVVCNSLVAKKNLTDHGISETRVTVIGNGLPDSAFSCPEPLLPRVPGVFRVGMIARMNARYKNHHVFLDAAALLSERLPNVEFVLVGDGPLRAELTRLAERLQIGNKVLFLGDRRDIPAVLASLDVSVVSSSSESLSNVILESMAARVAVVASRVGGNPELVGDDRGLLVVANDQKALCEALEHLLKHGVLRARLSENGQRFAKANFAIRHIVKQYEDLYAETLERKRWRPNRGRLGQGSVHRPIRVALVAPSLRYVGGQAVQADLLLRNWKNDPEVDARFIPVDPVFPRRLKWAENIPFLRTIIREPIYLMNLWRGLRNVDVAHLFSASYWSFLLAPAPALALATLRGKKTLINYRSGEARDHLCRFRTARPILATATSLVVPSGFLAEVFQEFGLTAQVVPNMTDLSLFSFRPRTPLRPHLICTRGFHPYYCVDLVVRAFAEVQQQFPDARLDLVGQGPLEQATRDLVVHLGLQGVRFTGVAGRSEIGKLYDAADIFINASALDNMPVSILEAFASGTPVVSTAPEGMRYVIEHECTGLLSEPGDASALAQNVIRLLSDQELSCRLASNAYRETNRYCWTAVRGQWLDIYRSLSGQQNGASRGVVGVA